MDLTGLGGKMFGFNSVFNGKPWMVFKGGSDMICLKKIALEYWKYRAITTIQRRNDGGLD